MISNVQASLSLKSNSSQAVAKTIVGVAIHAVSGALAGHLFQLISPAGGAVFGVAVQLPGAIIAKVLDGFFGNTTTEKTLKIVTVALGSIFIALNLTVAAGFSITFAAGIKLSLLMIPAGMIAVGAYAFLAAAINVLVKNQNA